jgi:hypothetical protein
LAGVNLFGIVVIAGFVFPTGVLGLPLIVVVVLVLMPTEEEVDIFWRARGDCRFCRLDVLNPPSTTLAFFLTGVRPLGKARLTPLFPTRWRLVLLLEL